MKPRLVLLGSSTALCLVVLALGVAPTFAGGGKFFGGKGRGVKVCICHVPPGNPANAHTICVGAPAVQAHLRHGDSIGACAVICGGSSGATCDAGEFCQHSVGVCDEEAEGVCVPVPTSCPDTPAPVCGCDGITYDNACLADAAGIAILHAGSCACETPSACGGTSGATCETGEFCEKPDGACAADAEGICKPMPGACPSTFAPVCGCDGTTYSNACFADAAGVPVMTTGPCPAGTACGGTGEATCPMGQFCLPPVGTCTTGAAGLCAPIPQVCPQTFSPVCGCDGTTYDNACNALNASVAINHTGPCEDDQTACGGASGTLCATGFFCSRPEGACATDAEGVCAPIQATCPAVLEPVCGCNGTTYDNACVASAAGVTIASQGACPAPEQQ